MNNRQGQRVLGVKLAIRGERKNFVRSASIGKCDDALDARYAGCQSAGFVEYDGVAVRRSFEMSAAP
jgi:hypothetical protein